MRSFNTNSAQVTSRALAAIITVAAFAFTAPASQAQLATGIPDDLEGVGITEHVGAKLPLDASFRDEDGKVVTLGDYFTGEKPAILTLVYFDCPMLCSLVINGTVDALKSLKYVPGSEFEIITVSFDPTETPTLAKLKKQSYITEYGRPEAASGWHFLTGDETNIKRVTETVGFGYKWNEKMLQYAHSAAIFVITPDGTISQYLYGIAYEPQTLRMSLLAASQGKLGTPLEKILMYCFHFDSSEGKYTPSALGIMRLGGGVMLFIVAGVMSGMLLRIRRVGIDEAGELNDGAGASDLPDEGMKG